MSKMRRWLPAAGVLVLLAGGCASQGDQEVGAAEQEAPLTVEEVLASTLGEEAYGETRRCLSSHQYTRTEVLDNEHIIFYGRRGVAWLNTLTMKCVGLRRRQVLQFEKTGAQLCYLDTVSSIENTGIGFVPASARCSLGQFKEMTEEQARLLVEQLHG